MSTLALTNTLVAGTPEDIGKVQTNFTDIVTWANGNVSDVNFPATAGMYTAYQAILGGTGVARLDLVAGTYLVASDGEASSGPLVVSGTNIVSFGAGDPNPTILPVRYLDDADHTISGRNTRLRVRGVVSTNATQPTITFTFGLYPVTFAGAADVLTVTLGAVVASSTAAVASPAASSTTRTDSADFAVPADGLYALGVVTSGTLTNNNVSLLTAELQKHWT